MAIERTYLSTFPWSSTLFVNTYTFCLRNLNLQPVASAEIAFKWSFDKSEVTIIAGIRGSITFNCFFGVSVDAEVDASRASDGDGSAIGFVVAKTFLRLFFFFSMMAPAYLPMWPRLLAFSLV